MNTEELFVLSALKEFVRVWGSGKQVFFNLECKGGKACIKFSTQLGSPGSPHFAPLNPNLPNTMSSMELKSQDIEDQIKF